MRIMAYKNHVVNFHGSNDVNNYYILVVYVASVFLFFMNNNTKREMRSRANMAPPAAPSIMAKCLCRVCFLLVKIVTCGVSIEEFGETSLHAVVEKERHKFPDVLHKS